MAALVVVMLIVDIWTRLRASNNALKSGGSVLEVQKERCGYIKYVSCSSGWHSPVPVCPLEQSFSADLRKASTALGHSSSCLSWGPLHFWSQGLEVVGTVGTVLSTSQALPCALWWEGWAQGQGREREGSCPGFALQPEKKEMLCRCSLFRSHPDIIIEFC